MKKKQLFALTLTMFLSCAVLFGCSPKDSAGKNSGASANGGKTGNSSRAADADSAGSGVSDPAGSAAGASAGSGQSPSSKKSGAASKNTTGKTDLTPASNNIVVWMDGDVEGFKMFYDGFAQAYPQYKLDYKVAASPDKLNTQLAAAVQAGNPPDAVRIFPRPADSYYTGLYQPMDKYLDSDPDYKRSDVQSMALAGNTFAGKTYFISEDLECTVLGWNKKLFRAAGLDPEKGPRTYSEFENYCRALTKYSGGKATQVGFHGNIGYWALSSAMGRYVTAKNGYTVEFDTPEIRKALEFSKKVPGFYNNSVASDDANFTDPTKGKVGMFYVNLKRITDFISDDVELGIGRWPVADDYTGKVYQGVYSSLQYGIPAAAKNPGGG